MSRNLPEPQGASPVSALREAFPHRLFGPTGDRLARPLARLLAVAPGSSPRRAFVAGTIVSLLALAGLRLIVNETTWPDLVVSPLQLADTTGPADAIVVLGAGVLDGCVPNTNGVRRTLLGAQLWRQGRARVILFTGGSAKATTCPIAVSMARLARDIGVPASAIHVEAASQTTHENAGLSARVLRGLGATRVLVVTDRLHMRRAAGVFAAEGFDVERASVPVPQGHSDNVSMLGAGLRESLALTYYWARGWLDSGAQRVTARAGAEVLPVGELGRVTGSAMQSSGKPSNSYAAGWQLGAFGRAPVVNRGVGGEQSTEMLARFERDVVPLTPRAVLVWGFINDIFRAPADASAAATLVQSNYTRMVELSRRHGIEPILATEVTIGPKNTWSETFMGLAGALLGKTSYQDRVNGYVLSTNTWLKAFATRERLLLLDFQATLAGARGTGRRRAFAQDDGSHITQAGYEALTRYARPLIERHLTR
jgi:uncharacterized SAM-binding protein YcdF (DUF218 family)/lysophospholipase L1-like esterase